MHTFNSGDALAEVLSAVGGLLAAEGERVAVVVVGGATMNLLGIVRRSTTDVDVIAQARRAPDGSVRLARAEPFPASLQHAIGTVARDFGLAPDWMNAAVGSQWTQGLPPALLEELTWRAFGGLEVGLVGRRTLVALKLFAVMDQGPRSVHFQDLAALAPTDAELDEAAEWVATQDAAPEFAAMIPGVIEHVRRSRP